MTIVKKLSLLANKRILAITFIIKNKIFIMKNLIKILIVMKQKMIKKNIIIIYFFKLFKIKQIFYQLKENIEYIIGYNYF